MKKLVSVIVLLFASMSIGASCSSQTLKPASVPTDSSDCAAACAKMQSLQCVEGQSVLNANGSEVSCTDFCKHEQDINNIELNPSCVKSITSCNQINTTCAVDKKS